MTDYGVYSTRWLLTQALRHVPQEQLHQGVAAMLYYMGNSEAPTLTRSWDILAQVSFTGAYISPEQFEDAKTIFDLGDDNEGKAEPSIQDPDAPPINQDDITAFLTEMAEYPDGEDPWIGGTRG